MTRENEGLGPIHVKMGSGNSVGHIGHIVFHQPQPSPNSMFQNDKVVGEIGSAPSLQDDRYVFEKLFIEGSFDQSKPFTVQGTKFIMCQAGAITSSSSGGRPAQTTLWMAECKTIA